MNNVLKYGFAFVCVMLVVGMIAGTIWGFAWVLAAVTGMAFAQALIWAGSIVLASAIAWITRGVGRKLIEQDEAQGK